MAKVFTYLPFNILSIKKISLHYHRTNLSISYLAAVAESSENQLPKVYARGTT